MKIMWLVASIYVFFQMSIVALLVVVFLVWDKRYGKNHGVHVPEGFERTQEISIDPSDGRKLRVYYNSTTGERFYHQEKSNR